MAVGRAALTWRRFTVSVAAPNFTVLDSGTGNTVTTALAAAGTQTLNLFTLPGGGIILAAKAKHRTSFTGGALTACTVEIGVAGDTDRYLTRFNIFQAVADAGNARSLQKGAKLKAGLAVGVNGAAAATVAGAAVGDRVLAAVVLGGPQAAFTGAGSNQGGSIAANALLEPGIDCEAIVTVNGQVQQLAAAGDTRNESILYLLESGGGLESDAAAGTAVSALFRTAGGAGNVNLLTAGVLDVWLFTLDAPQLALDRG